MILLIIALFANSKAKIGRNGSKKEKPIFKMCPRISGLGGFILSKKSNSFYPNVYLFTNDNITRVVFFAYSILLILPWVLRNLPSLICLLAENKCYYNY